MSQPAGQTCLSCHYFDHGYCHRNPPSRLRELGYMDWPEVSPHDWCGEWAENGLPPLRAAYEAGGDT